METPADSRDALAFLRLAALMTPMYQPIWRCKCGHWQPRSEDNEPPYCPYCCRRCPPGECLYSEAGWQDKTKTKGHMRVQMHPAVRRTNV